MNGHDHIPASQWGLPDDRADHWVQAEQAEQRQWDLTSADRLRLLAALKLELEAIRAERAWAELEQQWLELHPKDRR